MTTHTILSEEPLEEHDEDRDTNHWVEGLMVSTRGGWPFSTRAPHGNPTVFFWFCSYSVNTVFQQSLVLHLPEVTAVNASIGSISCEAVGNQRESTVCIHAPFCNVYPCVVLFSNCHQYVLIAVCGTMEANHISSILPEPPKHNTKLEIMLVCCIMYLLVMLKMASLAESLVEMLVEFGWQNVVSR